MKVTVYATTRRSSCAALKSWLDSEAVLFENRLTDADPAARGEFLAISDGYLGVPFTVIETADGEIVMVAGFDKRRLRNRLRACSSSG